MKQYILRRIFLLIPTLLFASVIVFFVVRLIPGNIIDLMLSQNEGGVTAEDRAALERAMGLDRPFVIQYWNWLTAIVLRGDLGHSLWQKVPVTELLQQRIPITFELGTMSLLIALTLALPIGVLAAIRQDTRWDYVARSFSILMLAIPGFWLGTLVVVFPSIWWGWSPELVYVPFWSDPLTNLGQMFLPAFILGTSMSAVTMRLTRAMMLEVLRQDYIRTAWAKGLAEHAIVTRHALRNALIPVVTLIGIQAPIVLGGAVIIEQIFVIPGMGSLLLEAVSQRDYPVITGVFLIVGVTVMLINLAVDISYGFLDPTVRLK